MSRRRHTLVAVLLALGALVGLGACGAQNNGPSVGATAPVATGPIPLPERFRRATSPSVRVELDARPHACGDRLQVELRLRDEKGRPLCVRLADLKGWFQGQEVVLAPFDRAGDPEVDAQNLQILGINHKPLGDLRPPLGGGPVALPACADRLRYDHWTFVSSRLSSSGSYEFGVEARSPSGELVYGMDSQALALPEQRSRELLVAGDEGSDPYNGPPPDFYFQSDTVDLVLPNRVYSVGDFLEFSIAEPGDWAVSCSLADPTEFYVDGVKITSQVFAGHWGLNTNNATAFVERLTPTAPHYTHFWVTVTGAPRTVRIKLSEVAPTLGGRTFTHEPTGLVIGGLPQMNWTGPFVTIFGRPAGEPGTRRDTAETEGFVMVDSPIRIEAFAANPDTVEPGATNATINATVRASGMQAAHGNYTMTIRPSAPSQPDSAVTAKLAVQAEVNPGPPPSPQEPPVKTFTGDLIFSGEVATISRVWDGTTDPPVRNFPDGDCIIELSVTVTEAGGGEPKTASANATVTAGGGTVLDVLNTAGNVIASTEGNPERQAVLQNRVHDLNGNIWVRIRNLTSSQSEQVVSVNLDPGSAGSPIRLARSQVSNTTYENKSVPVTSVLTPVPAKSFTITNALSGNVTVNGILNGIAGILRPDYTGFGRLEAEADPVSEQKNEAKFNSENFRAGGYQLVTLTSGSLSTRFRARRLSQLLICTGHGQHNDGSLTSDLAGTKLAADPAGVGSANAAMPGSNPYMLMLNCWILRVHFYQRNFGQVPGHQANPSSLDTQFGGGPGLKWHGVVPGSTMLGFTDFAYMQSDVEVGARSFLPSFKEFASSPPNPDWVPLLWMRTCAHQLSDAAAAINPQGDYYYVQFALEQEVVSVPRLSRTNLFQRRRHIVVARNAANQLTVLAPPTKLADLNERQIPKPPATP